MGVLELMRRFRPRKQPRSGVWFEGSGTSADPILVRGAQHDLAGVAAEFAWLQHNFGQRDSDWRLIAHSHGSRGSREIDTIQIELPNRERCTIHFDITESFGNLPE